MEKMCAENCRKLHLGVPKDGPLVSLMFGAAVVYILSESSLKSGTSVPHEHLYT